MTKQKNKQKNQGKIRKGMRQSHIIPYLTIIGTILTIIVTVFIKPHYDTWYNHHKQLSIEGNAIYNINKTFGVPEDFQPKYYSNFIFNQVTVHQSRNASQAVTEIELFNVKKTDIPLPDVQYDGGFYFDDQRFVLLAYNNGNAQGLSQAITVHLTITDERHKAMETYVNYEVAPISLGSGEVKSLWIKSFDELIEYFKKNPQFYGLNLSFDFSEGDEYIMPGMIFNRKTNKFESNFGGPGGYPPLEIKPLLDLTKDVSKQSAACHIELTEGSNEIDFVVLVDRTCYLEYKVALLSGETRVESKDSYQMTIRVPIYNQEKGQFYGDFYRLFKNHPQIFNKEFSYTSDEINRLDENLLYQKYKAAKEHYHFEED